MFWNYIKITFRVIARNPLFSSINIGGIAIGLAVVITIFLFVRDEVSYDRFFTDVENIYKIEMTVSLPGQPINKVAVLQGIAVATMQKDFPSDVAEFSRMDNRQENLNLGDRKFQSELGYVDSGFLRIFDFDVVAGSIDGAISDPLSLVLTKSLAITLFGDDSAIGELVTLDSGETHKVTAVINDVPENSHFQFQALAPINEARAASSQMTSWGAIGTLGYLKLQPGTDVATLEVGFPAMVTRNAPESLGSGMGLTATDIFQYSLINVQDVHLNGAQVGAIKPGGNIPRLIAFSAVAALILLIACINFVNLSTARSLSRAREVAIRKVVGGRRSQIMVQFLGEATVLASLALALALSLVELVIPAVNEMISKSLSIEIASDPLLAIALFGLTIIVGIGAGLYPAFVLSSFRPAETLKASQSSGGSGSTRLRAVLVTAQFAISIGLIAATAIVYLQTEHMKNLDPGFKKEDRMVLRGFDDPSVRPLAEPLRSALEGNPDIISTAMSMSTPGGGERQITAIEVPGLDTGELLALDVFPIDSDYIDTYEIAILAGRKFDGERETDYMTRLSDTEPRTTASVILTASALGVINAATPEEAIGRTFITTGQAGRFEVTVIGVVPDMQFMSAREVVPPGMFVMNERLLPNLSIHFKTNDIASLLTFLDETWASIIPGIELNHEFVDDLLVGLYVDEDRRTMLLGIFSGLAILVSALGMFALASFAAERRTKEIGIRKVMGAKVSDIVRLMVSQLTKPVLAANVIAVPATWYFTRDWLAGFAYRIDLTPIPFLIAGVAGLFIAWATVSGHAFIVARRNPIDALRYE